MQKWVANLGQPWLSFFTCDEASITLKAQKKLFAFFHQSQQTKKLNTVYHNNRRPSRKDIMQDRVLQWCNFFYEKQGKFG